MKITSAAILWLACLSAARGQTLPPLENPPPLTPSFVPMVPPAPPDVTPAQFTQPRYVPGKSSNGKIVPVAAQMQPPRYYSDETGSADPFSHTNLPDPKRLFMRESEPHFYDRIALEEKRRGGGRAIFPAETVLSKQEFKPREFPHMVSQVEPGFVLHRRLLFEQPNFERGGWDFGIVQPLICLSVFYYDLALLPYHFWEDPRSGPDGSMGKCLPGDQAPLRVPIEHFSVTGALGEAGVLLGGAFLFP